MSTDELTCAVWYVGRYWIDYDACTDEADAASEAAALENSDDAPTILGVQFADGQTIKAEQWQAFIDARKRSAAMWAEASARPTPPMRTIHDPFTGEALEIDWLGDRRG